MNIDTFNILTRKAKGASHQQTVLSIDWSGIDHERLVILARHAVVHSLQTVWKRDPLAQIPAELKINAVDFVKGELHEVLVDRPEVPKQRPPVSQFDKMMASLSPEAARELLKELEG